MKASHPRRIIPGATIFMAVGIVAAGAANMAILLAPAAAIASDPLAIDPAESALVLGTGRMRGNNEVSPVYRARIEAAAALFAAGKVGRILISGYRDGEGRPAGRYDELADMREDLRPSGVPEDRIIDVGGALRTRDAIARAHCVAGPAPVIVISQRDHGARALSLSRALGYPDRALAAADPPAPLAARLARDEFWSRFRAMPDILSALAKRMTGRPAC